MNLKEDSLKAGPLFLANFGSYYYLNEKSIYHIY